jgi:flagellin-like protein
MKFMKEEDAVSPVIGVILMVAITVILAAVIAAFVFGMSGGVSKTKNVAVTAAQVGDTEVDVTLQGGADFTSMDAIKVDVGTVGTNTTCMGSNAATYWTCTATVTGEPEVGAVVDVHVDSTLAGSDHVVAVAHFEDGSEQVVLDTYV